MMSDSKPSTDSAGSIRAAGGGFAKMEIAHEEEYFYKLVNCIINKFPNSIQFLINRQHKFNRDKINCTN